jgi:hypothetical protein
MYLLLILLFPAGRVRREFQKQGAVIRTVPNKMRVFVMRKRMDPAFTCKESVKSSFYVPLVILSINPGENLTIVTQVL